MTSVTIIQIQRSAKRRGCLLSYSQAEPGRELTQPSPRLLAEPCKYHNIRNHDRARLAYGYGWFCIPVVISSFKLPHDVFFSIWNIHSVSLTWISTWLKQSWLNFQGLTRRTMTRVNRESTGSGKIVNPRLREWQRQIQAEVVRNSRIRIFEAWDRHFDRDLHVHLQGNQCCRFVELL